MSKVKIQHLAGLTAAAVVMLYTFNSLHHMYLRIPNGKYHNLTTKHATETRNADFLQIFYDDIKCIKGQSQEMCNFPLLMEYQKRCGYFAELTSWQNLSKGFPKAAMSAHMCKVPAIAAAPKQLSD